MRRADSNYPSVAFKHGWIAERPVNGWFQHDRPSLLGLWILARNAARLLSAGIGGLRILTPERSLLALPRRCLLRRGLQQAAVLGLGQPSSCSYRRYSGRKPTREAGQNSTQQLMLCRMASLWSWLASSQAPLSQRTVLKFWISLSINVLTSEIP